MKALLAAVLLLAPALASAQESAAFLKIGVGARALGMGGAYTAVTDDVSAMNWNPAGLSLLSKKELGLMHAELPMSNRFDFIGYGQPYKGGAFGASLLRLDEGRLEGRDAAGRPTGGFNASDTAFNVSYGLKVGEVSRLGGTLRLISSNLAGESAQTFAADLGAMREFAAIGPGTPRLGLAVQNLGPGLKFVDSRDDLPLTIAVGAGYRLPASMVVALDVKHRPHSGQTEVSIGTEYALLESFALRAGYGYSSAAPSGGTLSALSGFAVGFGLKRAIYSLDYAITPLGELGLAQRFSFGARF